MVQLTFEEYFLQEINNLARSEEHLLQEINNLAINGKIRDSVGLTAQKAGLTIQKLIPTTRQRLNAAKFHLDLIGNIDYASCLRGRPVRPTEQIPPIDFSNSDLQGKLSLLNPDILPSLVFLMLGNEGDPGVQILELNPDTLPLIVFLILSGFFSHLVSSEDCLAKIINVVYDLVSYNKRSLGSDIRKKLKGKIPYGRLIRHLRSFYRITRNNGNEVEAKKGSTFNIAKQIRNELTHDDITDIIDFPSAISLSGFVSDSDLKLYFRDSFFSAGVDQTNTEIITFCHSVFKETVVFIDECYKLILGKLRSSGHLPV